MKTLPETVRELLLAAGVLQFDENDTLVFVGLTVEESQFFLDTNRKPPEARSAPEDRCFNQLRHRHIAARIRGAD